MSTTREIDRAGIVRIGVFLTATAVATFFLLTCLSLREPVRAQTAPKVSHGAFEVTSLLGRKLYAQPDDAVIAARKKLAADPKNASLVLALSVAQAGRRQYREAVATCTKGLSFAPNRPR